MRLRNMRVIVICTINLAPFIHVATWSVTTKPLLVMECELSHELAGMWVSITCELLGHASYLMNHHNLWGIITCELSHELPSLVSYYDMRVIMLSHQSIRVTVTYVAMACYLRHSDPFLIGSNTRVSSYYDMWVIVTCELLWHGSYGDMWVTVTCVLLWSNFWRAMLVTSSCCHLTWHAPVGCELS